MGNEIDSLGCSRPFEKKKIYAKANLRKYDLKIPISSEFVRSEEH